MKMTRSQRKDTLLGGVLLGIATYMSASHDMGMCVYMLIAMSAGIIILYVQDVTR